MPSYRTRATFKPQRPRRRPRASVPGRGGVARQGRGAAGYGTTGTAPRAQQYADPSTLNKYVPGGNFAAAWSAQLNGQPAPPAKPPTPPGPQPLPFDPLYESTVSGARKQYDLNAANLAYQEGQVKSQYGFDDASDPFSRARMLERNYQQATRNTSGGMAARGQLYSGSTNRALGEDRFQHEQAVDTTRKSYQETLNQITQQRKQAELERDQTISTAGADRVYRAQENREDPGPPPSSPAQQHYRPRNSRGVGGGFWVATAGPNKGKRFKVVKVNGVVFHEYPGGKRVKINNPYA